MAGERGPLPKRTEERRRRNKPERPVDRVAIGGGIDDLFGDDMPDEQVEHRIEAPKQFGDVTKPAADPDWHPVAAQIYNSLDESGQSIFFEPSDWAAAYMICESISRDLGEQPIGNDVDGAPIFGTVPMKGANLAAYLKGLAGLGMTEGDRRRMSIELTRANPSKPAGELPDGVVDMDAHRQGLLG